MPSASLETLKDWPHGQRAAFELLETNFTENGGWYSLKDPSYQMTDEEDAALWYLIEEWDYGYLPKRKV